MNITEAGDSPLDLIVVTHEGRQHADEILAVSMLGFVFDGLRVIRSGDPSVMAHADFRLDCGSVHDPERGWFDHHGCDKDLPLDDNRPAGYATSGLVWRTWGSDAISSVMRCYYSATWTDFMESHDEERLEQVAGQIAGQIDEEVVVPIDTWDNGMYPPNHFSRQWLPVQWLITHIPFGVAVESVSRALTYRIWHLLESVASEWRLVKDLFNHGDSEFYLIGDGLLVVSPAGRVELSTAGRVARACFDLPLVGVVSPIRKGSKWAAMLTRRLPETAAEPKGLEYTRSRKGFYHWDLPTLISYVRSCSPQD